MLLPVTLSCDKNNHNGNIRAYFKKVRCDTATFGHLALIVLLWICPNSKKETKYETVHERNSFNKEIGKLVKDFVLIDYEQSLLFGEDCRSIQNKSVKKKWCFRTARNYGRQVPREHQFFTYFDSHNSRLKKAGTARSLFSKL